MSDYELIDKDVFIKEDKNNLIIKVNWSEEALGILIVIIGCCVLGGIFIILFFRSGDFFYVLIFLILFSISILFIPLFLHYRGRIIVWNFDKSLKKISCCNLKLKKKESEDIKFSFIKYIVYSETAFELMLSMYLDSSKEVLICLLTANDKAKKIGKKISDCLEKPLYRQSSNNDLIFIYDPRIK